MPTRNIFRPASLLAFLPFLSLVLSAGTTFQCKSQTSHMFHQDCAVAANQLILSLTRNDGQTHIPNDDIMHTVSRCQAIVRASGGEKSVQGSALLLSFAQVGSRCQDGTFTERGGTVSGGISGSASWKRGNNARSMKDRTMGSIKRALSGSFRNFKREMGGSSNLQRRGNGEMMAARKGNNGEMYRLMMVSAHGVPGLAPSSPQVNSMFYQRSREFFQHHFTREDTSDLVFGNAYPIQGDTHVSVVTLGIKLRGGQKSWKEFVEGQRDNGKVLKQLISDGITMFTANKYVAAYFQVLNASDSPVFSFLVYGYDSVDSPLPS
ncbi:hypothetical protein TWF225_010131 [Orbilia oligospora]|nr:hypothetical protein TWF225_010131 [Orbilia oligospora]KAF3241357.1 hypothetical protein TWF128_011070 [Orbilia oligospora]KAF3244313.1 hypothetical protein TWF217_010814 [Orbilia oligospora]KAF3296321.1 hypothetical protein TWF132_010919 [Orbilia oligospora]